MQIKTLSILMSWSLPLMSVLNSDHVGRATNGMEDSLDKLGMDTVSWYSAVIG